MKGGEKMKKLILIISIFFIAGIILWLNLQNKNLSSQATIPVYKNMPDGFRGIKWGTKIDSLNDMKYLSEGFDGGLRYYTRKNDDLSIGKAKLEAIWYGFCLKNFCQVMIFSEGYENYTGLRDAVFEKYGKGHKEENKNNLEYSWTDSISISLSYDDTKNKTILQIINFPLFYKMIDYQNEYDKQKAKEGAEKGF